MSEKHIHEESERSHSYTCEIHKEAVKELSKNMPDGEFFLRVADFFKIFGDPTRAKIIYTLEGRELCVCDISAVLGMTKSAVSHQLSILRQANLVKYRRDGKNIYYSLSDHHIKAVFEAGSEHINE